jgi:hypothetical protein
LHPVSTIVEKFDARRTVAHGYRPGEIVPRSGTYTITRDPQDAGMPHEVAGVKGRAFRLAGLAGRPSMPAKSITSRRRMLRPGNRFLLPSWRSA